MKRLRRSFTPEFKLEAASLALDQGYSISEACRALDVRRVQTYALIDLLREFKPIKMACHAFGIKRSSYYDYRRGKRRMSRRRLELKAHVHRAFKLSRSGWEVVVSVIYWRQRVLRPAAM